MNGYPPGAPITILEGEKCADIATAIGLPYVTTSAHGAQSPQMTDWSPLAGRSVAIVRDEGERGGAYADKVSVILAALHPPAVARTIRLPGLGDGDDIEQWIAAQRAAGCRDNEILDALHAIIESAAR